jgi:hypothetical protein
MIKLDYIGIDCGLDGALVILNSTGIVSMRDMPTKKEGKRRAIDIEALDRWFEQIKRLKSIAVVEDPGRHAPSAAGLRSMTYSFAVIEALLVSHGIQYTTVGARKWQKQFLHRPEDLEGKFDTKAAALVSANNIWKGTDWRRTKRSKKAFDGYVDAALIAEYGRLYPQ